MDFLRLALVLAAPLAIGLPVLLLVPGSFQRLMLAGLLAGLTIYAGVGAADPDVPVWYLGYFCLLLLACAVGFTLAIALVQPLADPVAESTRRAIEKLDAYGIWVVVIVVFVALYFLPLLWPEVRIRNLWAPSPPDLTGAFARRFDGAGTRGASPLVYYGRIVLTPLFLIALFRLRARLHAVALLFAALLYLDYAAGPYLARNTVLVYLGILGIAVWQLRPHLRRVILVGTLPVAALALVGAYSYTFARLGADVPRIGVVDAAAAVWATEAGFPRGVAVPLIESGKSIDLEGYLIWAVTLPTPKVIVGEVDVPLINFEISEIVLGLPRGERGWYVVLGGLVAESVYLFGRSFFWLHGLFLGALAGLMTRLVERTPQLVFLQAYLVMLFTFVLNRAGIASLLPTLVNEFILVYALMVFGLFLHRWRESGQALVKG